MAGLLPNVDPDGLLEFSVVYTDRSLNHMSKRFQQTMLDIDSTLKDVYSADSMAIVPGGGTYGMEAIARQFATAKKCLVIRNGFFSYRWSQIFDAGDIPSETVVMKASRTSDRDTAPFAPTPVESVVETILEKRPDVVFAPHVETASGMILPDDYIRRVTAAVRQVGGLMVLDCIASGAIWVDMAKCGVDVLVSAPQKGWSASPCAAFVMMNERAMEAMESSSSTSFSCDLKRWHGIMQAYLGGGHAYHATMPTDALITFRDTMKETEQAGFESLRNAQIELGSRVRDVLEERGFPSVAADGFKAPGVVVSYTDNPGIQNGSLFAAQGLQIAAGVPLMCDEGDSFRSFRLGLFGLDKLSQIGKTVSSLETALDRIQARAA
ncbi:MAG: alanine--glyoxylate aminotransferase family protein [Gammaproteobacteria bacterium]|nr:alanine--glyoxylate aminotransferase family protein [Gammaproteobacteria bacterium]MYD75869.1 alanine--glyoxylate aminotransferase family protein [Gammaproteobacteria bacterium]MYJ52455.1 alanine--glyoxylate aminotransferase family protein [Gammaproteobacteria bacterium]